ncbi:phosphomannomutase/phosphoglucomutase [Candidatus Woesearchaeota archaeon]|nr:phosphomannomutase/phosphoglucomutase [Candidatus Woesearchaeota archaeon]
MGIFKAYDVRGIYPKEINKELAYKIGRAFVQFLKVKQVVVGRDCRLGGEELYDGLTKGITDEGADVINIGFCSSPSMYFAVNFLNAPSGIMITASHNPKEYNGFKFTKEKAIPLSGDTGIKNIENLVKENKFGEPKEKGKITDKDISSDYVAFLKKFIKNWKKIAVVIDSANGMAGPFVSELIKDTPLEVTKLFFEPDGNFPNHDPNPLKGESLVKLREKMKEVKAELGVAFDGDADRVFFITDEEEIVPADFITCLIAEEYLRDNPGETVLYDLRSSWITKETIEENKGKPSMSRVGHAFIKGQMRKENGIFAGELSGHFYFRDAFYTDSGILAFIMIMNQIYHENKKLSELIKPLKKYFASGEINSEVTYKEVKMKELAQIYKDGKVSWLDGVRVDFDDWWFNVRPSNTEPLLRLNLEAKSKELMEEKRDEILKVIRG